MKRGVYSLIVGILLFLNNRYSQADVPGSIQPLGVLPGSSQLAPALSGSGIVWTNITGTNLEVYFTDLSTPAPPIKLTSTANGNEFLADIYGSTVVWVHTGLYSSGDIIFYDLREQSSFAIAASTGYQHFSHPSIGGRYVVFERITEQYDIDVYDLVLGAAPGPPVTNDPAVQLSPRVSGDVIVYEDYTSEPKIPAVYGYHVSSRRTFLIAPAPAYTPDIDGNTVVYVGKDSAGEDQIYAYDLVLHSTIAITTAKSKKSSPRISNNRIVWMDDRNSDGLDIYSYDTNTYYEDLVAGGPGDQYFADVDGNRMVYTSNFSGNDQVFVFTFNNVVPPPPPGCDPDTTDLYDGPYWLSDTSYEFGIFAADPQRTYYLCLENGNPDGSFRASAIQLFVDGLEVVSSSDLLPAQNPPYWVTKLLSLDGSLLSILFGLHVWSSNIYQPSANVSFSIRASR